jgi:hypothetical protein
LYVLVLYVNYLLECNAKLYVLVLYGKWLCMYRLAWVGLKFRAS